MEFEFNVNYLLNGLITKLDHKVTPYRKNANGYDYLTLRKQLYQVIDCMGEASAKAQGLHGPITLARKLELSDHILYVMKDAEANNGKGASVGILKVGYKRLFVYNALGHQHEMEPLCVLDFYVHESRQRMGLGRKLFDFFLQDMNVNPRHLAIDKPSFKFSSFLHKHYNLVAKIPQVNNFVIFEGFFNNRTDIQNKRNGKPPTHPSHLRYNYRQGEKTPDNDVIVRRNQGVHSAHTWNTRDRPPSGRFSKASNNSHPSRNDDNYNGRSNRPSSGHDPYNNVHERLTSSLEAMSEMSRGSVNLRMSPRLDLEQGNVAADRALGARANLYSRHGNTPPPGSRPSSNTQPSCPPSNTKINNERTRSRNYNPEPSRPESPPMLQRNGPSGNYRDMLNLRQDYQGRQGHLKYGNNVGSLPHIQQKQSPSPPGTQNSPSWRARTDYNWTVNGALQHYQGLPNRRYTHTRLW